MSFGHNYKVQISQQFDDFSTFESAISSYQNTDNVQLFRQSYQSLEAAKGRLSNKAFYPQIDILSYKGCYSRVISNLLTGDKTWMHMFEPQRRADNKQGKRKDKKRPCITKRTISSKKMLCAIFFNSSGLVIQVPCPSGHTVTGRFYKNSVLKKVKETTKQRMVRSPPFT